MPWVGDKCGFSLGFKYFHASPRGCLGKVKFVRHAGRHGEADSAIESSVCGDAFDIGSRALAFRHGAV